VRPPTEELPRGVNIEQDHVKQHALDMMRSVGDTKEHGLSDGHEHAGTHKHTDGIGKGDCGLGPRPIPARSLDDVPLERGQIPMAPFMEGFDRRNATTPTIHGCVPQAFWRHDVRAEVGGCAQPHTTAPPHPARCLIGQPGD